MYKYIYIIMNQYDLTDENIQLILKRYKNKQIKDKERYQVNKTDPEFMMKNRQRAADHYSNNKHLKQIYYEKHGELKKARSLINYYTKKPSTKNVKITFSLACTFTSIPV